MRRVNSACLVPDSAAKRAFQSSCALAPRAPDGAPCVQHIGRYFKRPMLPAIDRFGPWQFPHRPRARHAPPDVPAFAGLPKPITVLQSIKTGWSLPLASVSARSISAALCPSQDSTFQPAAAKRARWSVRSDRLTAPSMVMSLLSHSTIRRPSFWWPARPIASWLMPSIRQPSPAMT